MGLLKKVLGGNVEYTTRNKVDKIAIEQLTSTIVSRDWLFLEEERAGFGIPKN